MSITGKLIIKSSCPNDWFCQYLEVKMYSLTSHISADVMLTKRIAGTERSMVYEATFDGKDVVMKFCFEKKRRDSLKRETKLYKGKLRNLQGSVIPIFYGYYSGRLKRNAPVFQEREMACIVLERCGEDIPGFECFSFEQRLDILDLMGQLHQQGYHHYDFAERNICYKDGKFRLIDLEDIDYHLGANKRRTKCSWDGDRRKLELGGHFPKESLSCYYLLLTGVNLGLWHSPIFSAELEIRGARIRENLDQFPPQVIVDKLFPGNSYLNHKRSHEAIAWLKENKKELDKCSDEQDVEEVIKRRVEEFPKDFVRQAMPWPIFVSLVLTLL